VTTRIAKKNDFPMSEMGDLVFSQSEIQHLRNPLGIIIIIIIYIYVYVYVCIYMYMLVQFWAASEIKHSLGGREIYGKLRVFFVLMVSLG